jgi:hypothetical protein
MNLFLELYQQQRARVGAASSRTQLAPMDLEDLERRTEALTLACQALWEILQDELNLSDAAILKKMQEVDLRDGSLDGRLTVDVTACPTCKRSNKASRTNCIYCGESLPVLRSSK